MFSSSIYMLLTGLLWVLIEGMFLVAAIFVFRAIRNAGSIILLAGAIGNLACGLFWFISQHLFGSHRPDYAEWAASPLVQTMRAGGSLSNLLFAVGVLMTVVEFGRIWRQNRALEDLVAGSLTDRGH